MVDQYEPSKILESSQSGSDREIAQQFVGIGENQYVGTKDGIKYTLISIGDNKFKLCDISTNTDVSLNSSKSSWGDSSIEVNRNNTSMSPATGYKPFKLMTLHRDLSSCQGQGDGNCFFSTPDSSDSPRFQNVNISIPDIVGEQQNPPEEMQTLTYTILETKQTTEEQATASYTVMSNSYYQVIPQIQDTPHRSRILGRPRQMRARLANPPIPDCSPIGKPAKRGRGRGRGRGRKPRKTWYQCKTPVLHSTPGSSTDAIHSTSSSSLSALVGTKTLSFSSCNESQASIEYPRAPNNTPTSEGEGGQQKILDMQQWIPQLQSRLQEGCVDVDPRESHNEKERKRRLRIKMACQIMRSQLPCVTDKTDNATVFENAVNFISFAKEKIGNEYDSEFLQPTGMF